MLRDLASRRDALALALGALALGVAGPAAAQGPASMPPRYLRPPRLKAGDVVGLIEPSGAVYDPFDLQLVEETVRALGLIPKRADGAGSIHGYLAGDDRHRAAGVNAMFADPEVKAIMAVRGGWGAARALPFIDFDAIRATPKAVIGLSDVTGLHLALQSKAGIVSFHGPTASGPWGPISVESFRALCFDAATPTVSNPQGSAPRLVQRDWRIRTIRGGKARGVLLGGNLTVLAALVGTPYMPDFDGAILVLEDIGEAEYRIDRMMTQLALSGILSKCAGVVFGQCTDCVDKERGFGGFPLGVVLRQHLEPLGVPCFQGAAFGHIPDQYLLPLGAEAEIDADAGTIRVLEPAVA